MRTSVEGRTAETVPSQAKHCAQAPTRHGGYCLILITVTRKLGEKSDRHIFGHNIKTLTSSQGSIYSVALRGQVLGHKDG